MTRDKESTNFWQTVPGILTAVAAVITAVTPFVVRAVRAKPSDSGTVIPQGNPGRGNPGQGNPEQGNPGRPVVDPSKFRVEKMSGDGQVVQPGAFAEFTVKVMGVRGRPISGARILWQTPSFHDDSAFVTATDDSGLTAGPTIHTFSTAGHYEQTASLIESVSPVGYTTSAGAALAGPVATFTFTVPVNSRPVARTLELSQLSPKLQAIMRSRPVVQAKR